jgi:ZIP family zinc transporter
MNTLVSVFLLSLVAGLGTGLGGLIAIVHKPGKRRFGFFMGIAAGVMISLSFLELVNEAWRLEGYQTATIGFGLGAMFMFLIDMLVPHIRFGEEEVHYPARQLQSGDDAKIHHRRYRNRRAHSRPPPTVDRKLLRSGMLIAIGITIHNIPEGIAVGAGYMHQPELGYFIALAILLHNIPEGIAAAMPFFRSGVCGWESFRVALFSGLVEPIGALVAALFLSSFGGLIPGALAFAGGVMVFITLDELIPAAREYGHQHYTAMGIILGAIFVFLLSGWMGI